MDHGLVVRLRGLTTLVATTVLAVVAAIFLLVNEVPFFILEIEKVVFHVLGLGVFVGLWDGFFLGWRDVAPTAATLVGAAAAEIGNFAETDVLTQILDLRILSIDVLIDTIIKHLAIIARFDVFPKLLGDSNLVLFHFGLIHIKF